MICTRDELLRYLGKLDRATPDEAALLDDLWPAAEALVKNFVNGPVEQGTFIDLLPAVTSRDDPDLEFVGWDVIGGKAVGYLPDDSRRVLALRRTPVRSVQAVYETWAEGGAAAPDPSTLLDPGQYYLDCQEPGLSLTGFLVKPWATWPQLARNVRVEYTAGYTPAELDPAQGGMFPEFKQAVRMAVAKAFRTAQTMQDQQLGFGGVGPISSEGMDGISFSYDGPAVRNVVGQMTDLPPEAKSILAQHVNYTASLGA